jgi:hypothetical protein
MGIAARCATQLILHELPTVPHDELAKTPVVRADDPPLACSVSASQTAEHALEFLTIIDVTLFLGLTSRIAIGDSTPVPRGGS